MVLLSLALAQLNTSLQRMQSNPRDSSSFTAASSLIAKAGVLFLRSVTINSLSTSLDQSSNSSDCLNRLLRPVFLVNMASILSG
jgi:hypothetical protein